MAMDFKETKEIEELKHSNKKETTELQKELMQKEHDLKMQRLEKLLEIAKAGGVKYGNSET